MLDDPIIKHLLVAILIAIGLTVLGRLVRSLVHAVARRRTEGGRLLSDSRLVDAIESKITILALIAGLSLGIREVRKGLTAENVTHHQVLDYLAAVLFIALVLILAQLLSRLLRTMIEWYSERVSLANRSNVAPAIVPFTSKLVNILIFFIVGMIILDHLGVNIGGLLVSLGVGSLAIALAAQETIANMIAWFVILVDQPIRIGDRIRLPSGEEGEVHQIGLRSTRIINPDNNLVIVPNGELVKNRIVNLSAPDASARILLEFNVAYGTDIAKARALLIGLAARSAEIRESPAPQVHVTSLGDAAIQLRLTARTTNFTRKLDIETEIREQAYLAFADAGIRIPVIQPVTAYSRSNEPQAAQKK